MEFKTLPSHHVAESSQITATEKSIEPQQFHHMLRHWTLWRPVRWMPVSASRIETDPFRCRRHDHPVEPFPPIYHPTLHHGGASQAAASRGDQLRVPEKKDACKLHAVYRKRRYLLEGKISINKSKRPRSIIILLLDVIYRERLDGRQIHPARVALGRILVKAT